MADHRTSKKVSHVKRGSILCVTLIMLVVAIIASVMIGSSTLDLSRVWHLLWNPDNSNDSYIVNGLRLTRTILGVLVGMALAVAGALMQAITRNPMADPGLLGVNSGAALAVVSGAAFSTLTSPVEQFFLALCGALVASCLVYAIGAAGRSGSSPVRLVLAGVAFSAAANGVIGILLLLMPQAFEQFRFWDVGALTRMDMPLATVAVPIGLALLMVLAVSKGLANLALGEDVAASLGTNVRLTQTISLIALTLLCASATAAAGPISFVGLIVPFFASWLMGANRIWIIIASAVLGPLLVLTADILGRILARPTEMPVGIVISFVGAPVLLYTVLNMRGDRR